MLPSLEFAFDRYFRVALDGAAHLPTGPAIYFGNHCGSTYTVEGAMLATAIFRRFGVEHPLYFLAHRAFYALPGVGPWLPEGHVYFLLAEFAVRSATHRTASRRPVVASRLHPKKLIV